MADAGIDVTRVLTHARQGDDAAGATLIPIVYEELRGLAARYLRHQEPGHTLQPTALVHEAYLRLIRQDKAGPEDRAHFIGLAARAMRSILVDHARAKRSLKRGGDRRRIPLDDALALFESRSIDLLALDEALEALKPFDEQQARIVELRFFGGQTNEEAAEILGVSLRTVERDWRMARAWLRRQIEKGDADGV